MNRVPAGPRPARRATIVDVAERAGVSRQTVTRALNDMPGISPTTRERVLAAAQALAYRPSRSGRALVRSETPVIGLIVSDLTNAFFSELATAMIREADRAGWSVLFAESRVTAGPVPYLGERVDALIGYSPMGEHAPGNAAVPVVLLDAPEDADPRCGRVVLDYEPALTDLREHLRGVGASRPAVLDASAHGPSQRAVLLRAALAPLAAAGQVPLEVLDDRLRGAEADAAREAALERLLAAGEDGRGADAIVAFNDRLAIELLRGLRRRGVRVPEQVRVIGVDGLALGELVTPTLTSLASDAHEIARHAVDLAIGIYEHAIPSDGGPDGTATLRRHAYRLVVRESA
ncbi:LacI family DNA-binding transcriptional regulator [Brachybacterium phenoliresistens]|uniref:LacI family transcriptional regulator n=1 Tax=Brachybacterium phenoliresistens TaxID=396014 RepID=Z9JXX4_9MICO|nr:LacI family DNA-binding transcriptional regulator [Brachybacterium phenoliresistens]EWS83004.1 LacI family transcriptional regulator [Brachybacterium phenoliresistens]